MCEFGDESTAALGATLFDGLFRDRDVVELLPRLLRAWQPNRFSPAFAANLLEATHYAVKMADRAAAEGVLSRVKRRGGAGAHKARREGDEGVDDDADDADRIAAARRRAADAPQRERVFDANAFVGEFAHPSVVQAALFVVGSFNRGASPRRLHYALNLLKRLSALPNDAAGMHPTTGAQLTWAPLLYHWTTLETAAAILNDR